MTGDSQCNPWESADELFAFGLFVDLLDQVLSQDMLIIGALAQDHLYLFILLGACFTPTNHAIGTG
jgi:hypothetical protein